MMDRARWMQTITLLVCLTLALSTLSGLQVNAQEESDSDSNMVAVADPSVMGGVMAEGAWIPPMSDETAAAGSSILGGADLDQVTRQKLEENISLNLKDEDLQNVVRLISDRVGLNVVMSDQEVTGKITLALENVPAGTALESILRTHKLTMVREHGGIVRVLPLNQIRKGDIEIKTAIIKVDWVRAEKVAATLQPFLSTDGRVQADTETNMVIISDTPHKLDELREIVKQLDVPEKQVMIEARLCELTVEAGKALGIQWDLATKDDDTLPINKFLNLIGDEDDFGNFIDLPSGRSTGPNGLLNDVGFGVPNVSEITRTITDPNGNVTEVVERTLNPPSFDTLGLGGAALTSLDQFGVSAAQSGSPVALWEFAKDVSIDGQDFNLTAAIDLLEERNMAKTLANPKVVTLNNVPADISIIRRIPYTSTNIGSGGAQSISFSYEDVGIWLKVTPTVTNNDFVRMSINPIQKLDKGRPQLEGAILPRPQVDERSSLTNVIVKDEDTAVLLGLRQQEFTDNMDAVPWVHRIPFFGWLFKGKSYSDIKTDLVAFVTPHIIKQPGLTEEEKARYAEIDDKWDLPDYFYDDVKWEESENR